MYSDVTRLFFPFLAVQIDHRPGSGRGLRSGSAGGPRPAVPAGQRNSKAAFVNPVPTMTAAFTNQTIERKRTSGEGEN